MTITSEIKNSQIARGLPPVISPSCTGLVLGSVPGVRSIQQHKYYAHPRNAFWTIQSKLHQFELTEYKQNCQKLLQSNIALWDVVAQCHRNGSLDANINMKSIIINNFDHLFSKYPNLRYVYCNGATSWKLFQNNVIKTGNFEHIETFKMPSTSPAYASMSLHDKLEHWSIMASHNI